MERLRSYFYETERKQVNEQELICKTIIEQIENKYNIKFIRDLSNGSKLTYLNIVTTILLIPSYNRYKKDLIELLEKNNINEKGLLYHLIGVINQNDIRLTEKMMDKKRIELISSFETLPYHQGLNWDNETLNIDTKYGRLKINRYSRTILDKNIKGIIKRTYFSNNCHSVVNYMKDFYPDDFIITSELPLLFDGFMNHSYIASEDEIFDITNDMIFSKQEFDSVFTPNEISKVKAIEFDDIYKKFLTEQDIVEDGMAQVLALALNNKMKKGL